MKNSNFENNREYIRENNFCKAANIVMDYILGVSENIWRTNIIHSSHPYKNVNSLELDNPREKFLLK